MGVCQSTSLVPKIDDDDEGDETECLRALGGIGVLQLFFDLPIAG